MAVETQNPFPFNPFQKYLIPASSLRVRYLMTQGCGYSSQDSFLRARAFPAICLIGAVALTAINTVTYTLQLPTQALLNFVRLSPLALIRDVFLDISSAIRSVIFIFAAAPIFLCGVVVPKEVYTFFCPDRFETTEAILAKENLRLQQEIDQRA